MRSTQSLFSRVNLSLYLVTDRSQTANRQDFLSRVERAVAGGVTCVQLRDPIENLSESVAYAHELRQLLQRYRTPLIINNRADVAMASGADGIHLGQRDFPYPEARRLLGPNSIIGLTVETIQDLEAAEAFDVNYIGVQVFSSALTKPNPTSLWGLEGLRQARKLSRHRIVAIGGICFANLNEVAACLNLGAHADGLAMVGALWRHPNPAAAARYARELLEEATRC